MVLFFLPKRERALRVNCRAAFHIFADSENRKSRLAGQRPKEPARVQVDLLRVVEKVRAVGRGRVEHAVVDQGCVQVGPQHHRVSEGVSAITVVNYSINHCFLTNGL